MQHIRFDTKWLFAGLLLLFAGCTEQFSADAPLGEELAVNSSLEELCQRFTGATVGFEEEIIVSGRVTSSDKAQNFYRSLILQEGSGAVEILVGLDKLHNDYPIGSKLYLRLKGLSLGRRLDILQVGEEPDPASGYVAGYLCSKVKVDNHVVRSAAPLAELQPIICTLDELDPSMCGLRIRIDALRYAPEKEDEPAVWRGYHRFIDREGRAVYSYVRPYADFADEQIPRSEGSLTGILQYDATDDGRYLLKPNDAADFQL